MLTFNSQTGSESSPTEIKALYLGDVGRITTDTVVLYCHGNKWHGLLLAAPFGSSAIMVQDASLLNRPAIILPM